MVGTTRFELATSPTPRVRSTRLSHVPTIVCTSPRRATAGYIAVLSVHDRTPLRPAFPSGFAPHTPVATIHPRKRKTHSSAPPETPELRASTAADDTRSAASSAVPPTRPTTSSKHSCKSSAQSQNRTAVHPALPSQT